MTKGKKDYEQTYTHPRMREEVKEEIKQSNRGGAPGQWSARKSQLLKQEYERRGGGYRGSRDAEQRSLTEWSQEEWQTRDGDSDARDPESGETRRYLPKEAWEKMDEQEATQTDRKKREASERGQQFVENTDPAKQARRQSLAPPLEGYDELSVAEVKAEIEGLTDREVEHVRSYEKRHRNRKTLIEALDGRLTG